MTRKEACAILRVSPATLDRYRRKLGISSETRDGIGEKHLESLQKLRQSKSKLQANKSDDVEVENDDIDDKNDEVEVENDDIDDKSDDVEVENDDIDNNLKQLKKQYDQNLKLISWLSNEISLCIDINVLPDKNAAGMLEKYQKLNVQILKSINKNQSKGSALEDKVAKMMAEFIGVDK